MADGGAVREASVLAPTQTADVADLVALAEQEDGFAALNEAALLNLRYPTAGVSHLLAGGADGLDGYAQLQSANDITSGALVVDPRRRGRGVGSALLTAMRARAGPGLRIWATRDTAAAQALAHRHGLVPRRTLVLMERALDDPLPVAEPPDGVAIRAFRPGEDERDWLAVNARAFATHPEQGSLTLIDLEQRMAEPWFDAAGFLVAVRVRPPSTMIGFHWTKRHSASLGEVYVLGIDPAAGVRGLGRPLLAAGLAHLRAVGCASVVLYVEADNERAVRLYEGFGFAAASRDVRYGPPEHVRADGGRPSP